MQITQYIMEQTKIQLSQQEMDIVTNADWILTKNEIMQKVKTAMGQLYHQQKAYLLQHASFLPPVLTHRNGKISKGENYEGLPYMILDHPRNFERENFFSVRSLFWWGRLFSTTLHISGKWQQHFKDALIASFTQLQQYDFFISTGTDEWLHDTGHTDYQAIKSISKHQFEEMLLTRNFIKIATHSPINKIENAGKIWLEQFEMIIKLLH